MIPENVLEALASVFEAARNMRLSDNVAVGAVLNVLDVMDESAADWVRSNPTLYPAAREAALSKLNGGENE